VRERTETIGPVSELSIGAIVVLLGVALYFVARWHRKRTQAN